jgi:hypothetical protein
VVDLLLVHLIDELKMLIGNDSTVKGMTRHVAVHECVTNMEMTLGVIT